MENTLTDILNLIHERETLLQNELARLGETKRLLAPQGGAKDTGRPVEASEPADNGEIPTVGNSWSPARRKRHSAMMKKRWAARKAARK